MLVHNNKTICYANSFVIIQHHIDTSYADNMHIIDLTHTSYTISYIKILNDLCLCIKCLYTFLHLNNITLLYITVTYFILKAHQLTNRTTYLTF